MDKATADETMDLSGVPCPQNTARALIRLGGMDEGAVLELIIDDGEPYQNVPRSLKEEGHEVLSLEKTAGGKWRLLVKKM